MSKSGAHLILPSKPPESLTDSRQKAGLPRGRILVRDALSTPKLLISGHIPGLLLSRAPSIPFGALSACASFGPFTVTPWFSARSAGLVSPHAQPPKVGRAISRKIPLP